MKDLKLTTLALTTTVLIASNLIIGKQYKDDVIKYEAKLHNQYKLIQQYKIDKQEEEQQLSNNQSQINNLNTQLDHVKKENDELKKQLEIRKEMNKKYFVITAYTSGYESTGKTSGSKGYQITASGTKVQEGKTIACPSSLDFGTKLNIENVGLRVCEDRGGAIKSDRLDLYVSSLSAAIEFGKQTLRVEILD
jgi:3D (Asp-Asp-Asp) domain-containing protein